MVEKLIIAHIISLSKRPKDDTNKYTNMGCIMDPNPRQIRYSKSTAGEIVYSGKNLQLVIRYQVVSPAIIHILHYTKCKICIYKFRNTHTETSNLKRSLIWDKASEYKGGIGERKEKGKMIQFYFNFNVF